MHRFVFALLALLIVSGTASSVSPGSVEQTLRAEIRRLPPPPSSDDLADMTRTNALSPKRAFLYSLALPGLGQAYASGWNPWSWHMARGVAYGAFEAVAWVRQQDNHGRGMDKQTEYRAYARENWQWRPDACANWNGGDGAIDDDPFQIDPIPGADGVDWYIDTEAEWLEFYEDIHKLQKWMCGWDDYLADRYYETDSDRENNLWSTPMQKEYRAMRQEQNDRMATADHWMWAIVGNHLVSAFDAYWTAKLRGAGGLEAVSRLPRVKFDETLSGGGAVVALAWSF
ncbi:MAG: hypothetical protein ABIK65_03510 [Candidatus Eisenbacteria bacterium]